jgi:hypothetical protein
LSLKLWSVTQTQTITYDSVIVKTIKPKTSQEEKVFNQINLDFAKKVENKDQDSLWERFWNWITDLIFGNSSEESKANMFDIFLWAFAIAGIIIIIWLLTRTEFTSFLRGNAKNAAFNFSDVEEDISTIDFNTRIKKAVDDNDYRLAIRWYYLKQLNILNETKVIHYEPFKTNIDYGFELAKSPHQQAFTSISRIYDYVWYGKYDITIVDYEKLEKQFKAFEEKIKI